MSNLTTSCLRVLTLLTLTSGSMLAQRPLPPARQDVQLRVLDDKGGPVQELRVTLLAVVAGAEQYRVVPGEAQRVLTTKDFPADFATLRDYPVGDFVLFVEADGHALTVSKPFRLPSDKVVSLKVKLENGATLEGVVTTPDGKPVADAEVTLLDRDVAENRHAFAQALAQTFVKPVTVTSRRTAADGSYHFQHVAVGSYAVRAQHADFAECLRHAEAKRTGKVTVPTHQLPVGCRLIGAVQRKQQRVGGATVVLQSMPVAQKNQLERVAIRFEVTTNAQGDYVLPLVPEGSYELMVHEGGDPISQATQMTGSRRTIALRRHADNQPQVELLLLK